jgi:hypothetical protein
MRPWTTRAGRCSSCALMVSTISSSGVQKVHMVPVMLQSHSKQLRDPCAVSLTPMRIFSTSGRLAAVIDCMDTRVAAAS